MPDLPSPPATFVTRKSRILQQLALPDADYTDASPKGSIDHAIRHLIDEINTADGFVTTSSCAGRISVFLEGRKAPPRAAEITTSSSSSTAAAATKDARTLNDVPRSHDDQVAGVGGKGAGGTWLYVSHEADPQISENHLEWIESLGLSEEADPSDLVQSQAQHPGRRLIHFKFEPMILHVLTASPAHAQLLLRCALQAGFRESGAVSIAPSGTEPLAMPVVAIRSLGLGLESLIGFEQADEKPSSSTVLDTTAATASKRRRIVHTEYLRMLLGISNERFVQNTKRIERFRKAFGDEVGQKTGGKMSAEGGRWEDPARRRERKRAEGLRRQAALQAEQKASLEGTESEDS